MVKKVLIFKKSIIFLLKKLRILNKSTIFVSRKGDDYGTDKKIQGWMQRLGLGHLGDCNRQQGGEFRSQQTLSIGEVVRVRGLEKARTVVLR